MYFLLLKYDVVALLAEGVDRNIEWLMNLFKGGSSPSSRRAWIEMTIPKLTTASRCVALLAEGVDRNFDCSEAAAQFETSPSSRRAWIEIRVYNEGTRKRYVALLAEGVDRNCSR